VVPLRRDNFASGLRSGQVGPAVKGGSAGTRALAEIVKTFSLCGIVKFTPEIFKYGKFLMAVFKFSGLTSYGI